MFTVTLHEFDKTSSITRVEINTRAPELLVSVLAAAQRHWGKRQMQRAWRTLAKHGAVGRARRNRGWPASRLSTHHSTTPPHITTEYRLGTAQRRVDGSILHYAPGKATFPTYTDAMLEIASMRFHYKVANGLELPRDEFVVLQTTQSIHYPAFLTS